jgi:hypothetical protein
LFVVEFLNVLSFMFWLHLLYMIFSTLRAFFVFPSTLFVMKRGRQILFIKNII